MSYAEETKGYCGDLNENSGLNVTWSFDSSDGTLSINGGGRMQDHSYPWSSLSDKIKSVIISRGVTAIGTKAFAELQNITSIVIPDSVIYIGQCAFENSGLKKISIELKNGGTSVVFEPNVFSGTKTNQAEIKVPGYHNVSFTISPTDAGFSINEYSFGNSEPDTENKFLQWIDKTDQGLLTATGGIPNNYTVIYNKNAYDATGTMYPQTFTYNKRQYLDGNQFSRSGYIFTGWAIDAKGDVMYGDGAEVMNLTEIQNGTVFLYAKWEKNDSMSGMEIFRLCRDCIMPSTGFSSIQSSIIPSQPKKLSYKPTGMRMMIPSLSVDMELVTVPMLNDSWTVEWLDIRGGILEGSALPGEGYSFVAAHNTLNNTQFGPFAMLSTLEVNDLVVVTSIDKTMKTFRVFENKMLNPADMISIVKIASKEENTLVLITCENETADGSYLNRRVIFSKPSY